MNSMTKKRKSTKLAITLFGSLLLVLGISSCSDNDNEGYQFTRKLATVLVDEKGYAESFVLDNGKTLVVTSPASLHYKPAYERMIIDYDILDKDVAGYDNSIHLYRGYDVLTKPVIYIPEDNIELQDSIGYDKIKVFSVWASSDYINIGFGYNTSGTGYTHMLNLVSDTEDLVQNGDEPIRLQFRHNAHKDPELYGSGEMYVCFKLDDYIKENEGKRDELTFEISWEEYSGSTKTETVKVTLPTSSIDPPQID